MLDPGKFDGGGGVDCWVTADPGGPTGGGGVDLGDGLLRCPG